MKMLSALGIVLGLLGMLAFAFLQVEVQGGTLIQVALFWSKDPAEALSRPKLAYAALSVLGYLLIMMGGVLDDRKVERRPKTSSSSNTRLTLAGLPQYD